MKEGWEYKKIGELCEILDSQRRPVTKRDRKEGIYPYYGASGIQDFVDSYIFDGRYLLVGEDGAKWGSLDKSAYIVEGKCWVNNHAHILQINDIIIDRLLEYYLVFEDLTMYITGAIVPKLTQKALVNIEIPVPPRSIQKQIVSELDLLRGVIDKQKAQLEELDKLAQSIFYDMFGDPCNNHKNFEVKPIEKVCILKAGKAIKAEELLDYSENLYPCYGGNGIRGYINRFSHDGTFPIIGRQGALCGNVNLANGQFYATEHAVVVTPIIDLNAIWLYYVLLNMRLGQYAHGVAQPGLSVKDISPLLMILPPLALQQEFAAKVEAIEAMKTKVRQSLKEAETLFNERMDYYFN